VHKPSSYRRCLCSAETFGAGIPELLLTPADMSTCCAAAIPAQGQKQFIHFCAVQDKNYSPLAPLCDILLPKQIKSMSAQGFLHCF